MTRYAGEYGTWQLSDLPGCSQVCVSHSAFVLFDKRNQGFGNTYHQQRLQQIRELKYDVAMATVDETNVHQQTILNANGWKKLHVFLSSKTGHNVGIWIRNM